MKKRVLAKSVSKPHKPPAEVSEFFKNDNIPEQVREYFREQGRLGGKIGGKIGGKRSLETMTPEERTARAKKAVAAREAKRAASKKNSSKS